MIMRANTLKRKKGSSHDNCRNKEEAIKKKHRLKKGKPTGKQIYASSNWFMRLSQAVRCQGGRPYLPPCMMLRKKTTARQLFGICMRLESNLFLQGKCNFKPLTVALNRFRWTR